MNNQLDFKVAVQLNNMVDTIGEFNKVQGWCKKSDEIVRVLKDAGREDLVPVFQNYLYAAMIALIHSELSEGLEGLRKNLMDDHLTHRKMIAAEMADVQIRLFDLCDVLTIPLGDVVVEKDAYNHHRDDHKLENRMKEGGKKF